MTEPADGAAGGESPEALIAQGWEAWALAPARELEIGQRLVQATRAEPHGLASGFGWLHVAFAEVRAGDAGAGRDAAVLAREIFVRAAHPRGIALADEATAIERRRAGDLRGCAALQNDVDARGSVGLGDHDRFVLHGSRAITAARLSRSDDALRHAHAAHAAALRTGWPGPVLVALDRLGACHLECHNLDDARRLSEEALHAARDAGAQALVGAAAARLVVIHHALGRVGEARAMGEFLAAQAKAEAAGVTGSPSPPLAIALAHLAVGEADAAQRVIDQAGTADASDADARAMRAWIAARCALARGDTAGAARLLHDPLAAHEQGRLPAQPYHLLQMLRTAADAAEAGGDLGAALAQTRRSQLFFEELVDRAARARDIAREAAQRADAERRDSDQADDAERLPADAGQTRAQIAHLKAQLRAKATEAERLQRQLEDQALRDPLTGLHNRRYLFEMAPRLIDLAARAKHTLCAVVVDLDRFKQLNDAFGHQAGDEVLKAFAVLLRQSLRRSDIVCRGGGGEFVMVMPDISADGAQAMLTRLIAVYGELRLNSGLRQLPAGSFSAGVAVFPRHGGTLDELLSRADRALHAAKESGRARVEIAQASNFASLD